MASPQKKKTTSKPRANRQTPKHTENLRSELRQDLWAIALFAIGVFIALCLWWTPTGGDRHMLGAVGFYVNQAAQWLFGQGKWFIAAALILLGASGWLKTVQPGAVLYVAYGILTASCCAIAHLRLPDEEQLLSFVMQDIGGGVIGGALVQGSNLLIGKTGSWILYVSLVAASVLLITGKTMRELASQAGGTAKTIGSTAGRGLKKISDKVGEMRPEKEPSVIDSLNLPIETALRQDIQNAAQGRNGAHGSRDGVRSENGGDALQGRDIAYHDYDDRAWSGALDAADGANDSHGDGLRLVVNSEENNGRRARNRKTTDKAAAEEAEFQPLAQETASYRLPSRNLLQAASKSGSGQQSKAIAENVRILEKTLDDFGVKAVVTQVNRGPSITRFELQPAAGVKVGRIVNLSDDLALALAAAQIRIEAPIPGKAAIGIEVPNAERSIVSLREVLEDPAFAKSTSKLTFALGKDIAGESIVGDLAKMPHLLIAGSTGSGKSVCLNALIASLLFSTTPDEVKLMMIDPKMVELSVYNDIPHLIHPVVTDPKKAAKALRWAVHEMERRYDVFAKAGVKDIARYNAWLAQQEQGSGTDSKPDAGQEGEEEAKAMPMPQFVIIIDELADLMLVAPADVEDSIRRIAQMARAAGMHLVVATQRPSVNVITGVIKANIPSRIAFAVSSQTDSRVILDMAGAEKLLGRGDMLYSTLENPKPVRVQGVYVSDGEIEGLTDYIKSANALPDYLDEVVEGAESDALEESEALDDLLPEAARIFIESGQASISLLQRRLRVGYTRAARIIDQMEEQGIVGGFEGSKARAIRMTMAQYEERFGRKA